MQITPETVGQATYDATRALLPVIILLFGVVFGSGATTITMKRRLSEKDAELDAIRKAEEERAARIAKVRPSWESVSHKERRRVIEVYLSGSAGAPPTEEERAHMDDWIKMRDLLEFDGRTLHLRDGVKELIESDARDSLNLLMAGIDDLSAKCSKLAEMIEDPGKDMHFNRMVRGFSPCKAQAALKAFESDGLIDAPEGAKLEIQGSIQSGQKVFVQQAQEIMGRVIIGSRYGITDEFRMWLCDGGNLRLLKDVAHGRGRRS